MNMSPVLPVEIADASPYPFPIGTRPALVVIDMQRDFLEPGGFGAALGNDVARLRPIIPTIARLLDAFRSAGLPIIHTKECHNPDLGDCPPSKLYRGHASLRIGDRGPMGRILIEGEPGNDFIPELKPGPGEVVIPKPGKGAFHATQLQTILEYLGTSSLIVTGVTTEVCVQTTLREANDRGHECLLVEDGTASYFPEFKAATLAMVRAQGGIVGWTGHAIDILDHLGYKGA
jgi:nicotinamidase-related amidase